MFCSDACSDSFHEAGPAAGRIAGGPKRVRRTTAAVVPGAMPAVRVPFALLPPVKGDDDRAARVDPGRARPAHADAIRQFFQAVGPCDRLVGVASLKAERGLRGSNAALAVGKTSKTAGRVIGSEYLVHRCLAGEHRVSECPNDVTDW